MVLEDKHTWQLARVCKHGSHASHSTSRPSLLLCSSASHFSSFFIEQTHSSSSISRFHNSQARLGHMRHTKKTTGVDSPLCDVCVHTKLPCHPLVGHDLLRHTAPDIHLVRQFWACQTGKDNFFCFDTLDSIKVCLLCRPAGKHALTLVDETQTVYRLLKAFNIQNILLWVLCGKENQPACHRQLLSVILVASRPR